MEQKELLTVIVADDETELREAVCSVIPWKEIGFRLAELRFVIRHDHGQQFLLLHGCALLVVFFS